MEIVSKGKLLLSAVVALLGAASVVLPAVAGSETVPAIAAVNSGVYYHYWSPSQVGVNAGGAVTLSNPTEVAHGVEWHSGPATPNCSGVPVGTSEAASASRWSGTCTFSQPGTYVFYCTVHHAEMTGTIVVSANGPTTTTTTQPPPGEAPAATSTPLASGAPAPDLGGSPFAGASPVRLTARGRSVRGSLDVSPAGAGARLEVDLLLARASLASTAHLSLVRVGRLVRSSLPAGVITFGVSVDAAAKRALRVHGHLALIVRVTLTPVSGPAVTIARGVRLHA